MRRVLLFLFSHRLLALARWEIHFILVRLRNVLTRSDASLRRLVASKTPIFVNLGSGPRGINDPRWVNVDGYLDKGVQFLLDFTRPLPFVDWSLDGVFCEHVFEHFSQDEGARLAREIRRCLRPDGVLRIVVPDAERIMQAYFENPGQLACRRDTHTAMEAVNSYFRQRYEHHFLYGWTTLRSMLEQVGFATVVRSEYGIGRLNNDIVLDDPKYEWESLYVEAKADPPVEPMA
jgi:predicted SAM-dependent methyltransferase